MRPDDDRFLELATEAVEALPQWVRDALDNVEIFVEDEPPPGSRLLGLYQGVPLAKRGSNYSGALPDRITLFAGPIVRQARGSEPRLRAIVGHTVAHEIAHHFGITDERLLEIDAY
jgi:predicted Zn-dependent protease with MMP-like domain